MQLDVIPEVAIKPTLLVLSARLSDDTAAHHVEVSISSPVRVPSSSSLIPESLLCQLLTDTKRISRFLHDT